MSAIDQLAATPEYDRQLADLIKPRWWTGRSWLDSERYVVRRDAFDSDAQLIDGMRRVFEEHGIVRVTDTGLSELQGMRDIATAVLGKEMAYEGGANPRGHLEPNVFEVGAPLSAWLHYHHEMAYIGESPKALAFLCRHAVHGRGHTYFSDNVAATDHLLQTGFGQRLRDRGVCYHRRLTDRNRYSEPFAEGVYNHWQKSLGTEDRDEAMALATAKGLEAHWEFDGSLMTRYYADAFEYFEPMDRNLLYASVADSGMWFDAWPMVMHLAYADRPLHMTYGDDGEFSRSDLQEFVDVYDRFGSRVEWQTGDVVVFCNYRFAHGRPSIQLDVGQARTLGVLLGEAFPRQGQMSGKW